MDEPEIVKLKKEIQLLNQYNIELKNQLEEQSIEIGEMKKKYNQLSTEYQINSTQNNIIKNKENIQKLIEKSLIEEKKETNKYKDSYLLLCQKINLYEQTIKEKEIYIDKLVKENNNLKRDLIKSTSNEKNNVNEYLLKKEKQKEIENAVLIDNNKNILKDFNEICDQMENVIRENRILRQMADVPENFGIDISKIKLGEKIKIEDYKNKIRYLIHNIDELETERAQLKHNIYFLASSFQSKDPPFHLLSKEQKVDLAVYAQKLYEGKINNIDSNNMDRLNLTDKLKLELEESNKKNDDLKKILDEKNIYIKKLENELEAKKNNERQRFHSIDGPRVEANFNSLRYNNRYDEVGNNNNNYYNENDRQMNEIINLLKEQKDEFTRIINNRRSFNNSNSNNINRSNNNGNVYNIFHYNNNFFLSQNMNNGGFKNYLGSQNKIIRRSKGK